MRRAILLLLLPLLACRAATPAGRVRVVAAASLREAFAEIAAAFRREHPRLELEIVYSSSGAAVQQITQGAPFDAFYAADLGYPQKLLEAGKAVPGSLRVFARGGLALWIAGRIDGRRAAAGLRALADPRIRTVAVANPETAPYGRAALQALERAGLRELVAPKLVFGQDAAQAAQLAVASADAALLPYSLVHGGLLSGQGTHLLLPGSLHEPLDHGGVLLRDRPEVRRFDEFLHSEAGRSILREAGFVTP